MIGSCAHCLYWDGHGAGDWKGFGECRRHAPRPGIIPGNTQDGQPSRSQWPATRSFDWCGDWEGDEEAEERDGER